MFNSPENAAMPTVLASCEKNAKGGFYYGPTRSREMKGKAGVVDSSELSKDPVIASRYGLNPKSLSDFHTYKPILKFIADENYTV